MEYTTDPLIAYTVLASSFFTDEPSTIFATNRSHRGVGGELNFITRRFLGKYGIVKGLVYYNLLFTLPVLAGYTITYNALKSIGIELQFEPTELYFWVGATKHLFAASNILAYYILKIAGDNKIVK